MANRKTIKKKQREALAKMRRLCVGCAKDPDTCPYLGQRGSVDSCFWRKPL